MPDKPTRIGVLVSGTGSNLQAIIDAIDKGSLVAEIGCVISNRADSLALQRARQHGIPSLHIDHRLHVGRESYDASRNDWDGHPVYESFGEEAKEWYQAGARLIGGCCRTTPEDIRVIASWARTP